jgi:hypothetical protein
MVLLLLFLLFKCFADGNRDPESTGSAFLWQHTSPLLHGIKHNLTVLYVNVEKATTELPPDPWRGCKLCRRGKFFLILQPLQAFYPCHIFDQEFKRFTHPRLSVASISPSACIFPCCPFPRSKEP